MRPPKIILQIGPILSALGRHKIATALIVLQVALTLAVASNALFVVVTRVVHLSRPTGTDEAHLFVIRNNWKNGQDPSQIDADIRADLAALRKVRNVRDAFSSEAFPLEAGYGLLTGLKLKADQIARPKLAVIYFADDHAIDTLGVSLIAGRNFRADEITTIDRYGKAYLDCAPEQQKEILDLIAYRKNAKKDPSLGQGIEFFGFLRKLTADGFFTSGIGIEYLGYIGNTYLKEFPGCPPVPGLLT